MVEREPRRLPLAVRIIIRAMEIVGGGKIFGKASEEQSKSKPKIFKRSGIIFRRHQKPPEKP